MSSFVCLPFHQHPGMCGTRQHAPTLHVGRLFGSVPGRGCEAPRLPLRMSRSSQPSTRVTSLRFSHQSLTQPLSDHLREGRGTRRVLSRSTGGRGVGGAREKEQGQGRRDHCSGPAEGPSLQRPSSFSLLPPETLTCFPLSCHP